MNARTTVRTALLALAVLLAGPVAELSAETVAFWTFETNPPADLSNSATIGGVAADTVKAGVVATASGVHASANTDWTTPAGNGSANSLSANEWAAGDYFQFSMTGGPFHAPFFEFDQTRSATGPANFKVQADIGSGFFDVGSPYVVVQNTWSSGAPVPSHQSFQIPGFTTNLPQFTVRIVSLEAGSATGGTGRVDNVHAYNIPEPAGCVAALTALVGLGVVRWRA